MRRRFGTLLLLLVSGGASHLEAADSLKEQWRGKDPGRFHVGPLWLTPKIELVNAGVDTNVLNQLGRSVSDTTVVLRPSTAVALPIGRRARLGGTGFLDVNYFARTDAERSTGFGGDARGEVDVSALTLFGGGGGSQGRQRYSLDLEERPLRQNSFAFAGLDVRPGRASLLTVRGTAARWRYAPSLLRGPELQRALDRNTLSGVAELRYRLTALTQVMGSAEVIEDTFIHQRDSARATRSYRYLAGFQLAPRALVSGSVLAGLRRFPGSSAGSVPGYSGLALQLATATTPRAGMRLAFRVDRDVYFGLSAATSAADRFRNAFVSTRYDGVVDLDMPLGLIARPALGFQSARYLGKEVIEGTSWRRGDHVYSAGFSLLRRLGDSARVGGTISWIRRVSNVATASYEGFRYGIAAELAP